MLLYLVKHKDNFSFTFHVYIQNETHVILHHHSDRALYWLFTSTTKEHISTIRDHIQ